MNAARPHRYTKNVATKVGGDALKASQSSAIVNLMFAKMPDQLGLSFFL